MILVFSIVADLTKSIDHINLLKFEQYLLEKIILDFTIKTKIVTPLLQLEYYRLNFPVNFYFFISSDQK